MENQEIQENSAKLLISDSYRELNSELHRTNLNYGVSSSRWVKMIYDFYVNQTLGIRSILDYGAGKALLERGLKQLNPHLQIVSYDPCIPKLSKRPNPADLVICTDVLEHIEPDLVENVIEDLGNLTKKLFFCTIATRPAVKILADGRNAHLIQEPFGWWQQRLVDHFKIVKVKESSGEILLIALPKRAEGA